MYLNNEDINNATSIISGTLMFLDGGLGFSGLIDTLQGTTNFTFV